MRVSEQLLQALRGVEGLHLAPGARCRRLYPGYWQRAAGAWSWWVDNPLGPTVGGQHTMRETLRALRDGRAVVYQLPGSGDLEVLVEARRTDKKSRVVARDLH